MFERFSDAALRVVHLSGDEARRLGHDYIGTEHVLLGVLADGTTPAAKTLIASGAKLDATRDKVAEVAGGKREAIDVEDLPFSDRARRALERASRRSLRRRADHVETDDILIGVIDVEGRAGQALRSLGVDPGTLREALEAKPAEDKGADRPVPTPGPRCATCGAPLASALTYQVVVSTGDAAKDFLVAYCSACGSAIGAAAT
jgi:ATP-dependent Clp protease ATP-binding subunit ClpC